MQADRSCVNAEEGVVPISGVVAAASSVTSIQVANLLKLFAVPQVCIPLTFTN